MKPPDVRQNPPPSNTPMQDVELAGLRQNALEQSRTLAGIQQVDLERNSALAKTGANSLKGLLIAVHQHNRRASGEHCLRRSKSYSGCCARDRRNLPIQFVHRFFLLS